MPLYSYYCKACEHEFNEWSAMDDRKLPESEPCPECKAMKVTQDLSHSSIGDPMKLGIIRPERAFTERMKEIKKNAGPKAKGQSRWTNDTGF